jgi:hypothetical protein
MTRLRMWVPETVSSDLSWDSFLWTGSRGIGSESALAAARSVLVTFRLLYLILVRLCGWLALLPGPTTGTVALCLP